MASPGRLVLLALVPQGIGHTLVNRSLRHFSAATVSLALLGEVPGGILLAWLVLGEGVPPMRGLALAVIVLAVAVVIVPGGWWRGRVLS